MSFKDQLERDVNNVFLNPTEFADNVSIDGVIYTCIIFKDEFSVAALDADGVFMQNTHVVIDSKSIKTPPVEGQRIKIKNKYYYVVDVQNEQGVFNITASANQS